MEHNEEVTDLMDQLSRTYADPKVKADYYLAKLILKCAKVLDKTGDVNLVSAGYSTNINSYVFYLRTQKKNLPKSAIDLYYSCKKNKGKYDPSELDIYFSMMRFY